MVSVLKAARARRKCATPMLATAVLLTVVAIQFFAAREIYISEMALKAEQNTNAAELRAKDQRIAIRAGVYAMRQLYRASEDIAIEDLALFMQNLQAQNRRFAPIAGWVNLDPAGDTHKSSVVGVDGRSRALTRDEIAPWLSSVMDETHDANALLMHRGAPLRDDARDGQIVTLCIKLFENSGSRRLNGFLFTSFDVGAFVTGLDEQVAADIVTVTLLDGGVEASLRGGANTGDRADLTSFTMALGDADIDFVLSTPRPGMWAWYAREHPTQLFVQGAILVFLVAMTLVTIRHIRIAQAAEQRAESSNLRKTRFLATMSHEMRTPLNGILGMAELLRRAEMTACRKQQLDTLTRSGEALLALIDQILDFSKIEADALELDIDEADLALLIEETFEAVNVLAAHQGIPLLISLPLDVPRMVRVDMLRLRQVLTNLLANAIKFTSEGHVLLHVTLEGRAEDGRTARLRFSVEDTGIGISDAKRDEIFDAFSQADATTTRRFGGTGLGLTISRQIVQKMGGDIDVRSVEGKGSTFGFAVDVELSRRPQSRRREFAVAAAQNVLILVRNETQARTIISSLDQVGGFGRAAATAEEAVELLAAAASEGEPFDVVLFDDRDALAALRGMEGGTHKLGWIRSSTETNELIDRHIAAAVDFVCEAPQLPEAVMADIAKAVAHHKFGRLDRTEKCSDERYRFPGVRALLVEDDPVNRMYATELLLERDCDVTVADNGKDAVDILLSGASVDVVLLDCQMPVMDGFAAAAILRRAMQEGRIATVPVIALTANALKGDRERCLAAGMDDYLSKPVRGADMCRALVRQLPGRGYKVADAREDPVGAPDANAPAAPVSKVAVVAAVEKSGTPVHGLSDAPRTGDVDIPVVDIPVLSAARATMKSRFARLLGMFCGEGPTRIAEMRAALERRDYVACSRLGHTMKSSSRMLGAPRIASFAAELEETAARVDPDRTEIAALIDGIEVEVKTYVATIRRHARRRGRKGGDIALAS